ncbi:MAG: TonB-dependent receptor, partial [Gemmatimonadaceae bacterium]
PADVSAQQGCGAPGVTQGWPSPLDRRIALRARDVSLRDALDRLAAAGRFRVSYSAEFLPLDRRVCVWSDSIAAGDALAELLRGVSVAPIVTAADHVVIAPATRAIPALRESVQTLERVVVTGSATGNARRSLSVALDVIDGRKLDQQAAGSLSASFDGNIAGMWLWEQSPSTLLARYGSIRGASSFNVSYPKVYIDGIEVANPLLLTELNPAVLERVEVIRGPQGAALYGADAISGVVNIITRHEGLQSGAGRTEVSSRAGLSQTAFADRSVLAQNHSLTWRSGTNVKSGSLGMNLTTLGGYVPEAYSRDLKLHGGFRVVTSTASVTGTARLDGKRASVGQNPLILGFLPSPAASIRSRNNGATLSAREDSLALMARDSVPQSARGYTVGITSTLLSGTRWTPTFTAGIDGYRLSNVPNELALIPSTLDSALHSAEGGADRITFRSSLVGQYELGARRSLTMTFSAEHSRLWETLTQSGQSTDPDTPTQVRNIITLRGNSGIVAQANVALNDAVYLSGGLRVERNGGPEFRGNTVVLPMLGASFVRDLGSATLKLRGAYGIGIRPARTSTRETAMRGISQYAFGPDLDPERQSGVEVGADLYMADGFGVHLTRFDQRASGLIQPVALPRDTVNGATGLGTSRNLAYVLQNVGEITNRGWELATSVSLDRVDLSGAFTMVDSRVQRIARGYTGDLLVGERMLAVPAGTGSVTASGNLAGLRATLTASRAFDWINYDRLRLAQDYASCDACMAEDLTGDRLRSYWMTYDGVTRLRASVARELPRGLGMRLTLDNLTNAQRGEPDNITVLPGRTVLFGLSAKIR